MVFDFLKKKKLEPDLETPPPPLDGPEQEELPSFPSASGKMPEFPELPPEEDYPIPEEEKQASPMQAPQITGEKEEETPPPPEFLKETKRLLEKREVITKPVYVKVDRYRAIIEKIDVMINKLKENEEVLLNITELKNEQDVQYERWRDEMEEIEKKLIFIDKTLFEPKGG